MPIYTKVLKTRVGTMIAAVNDNGIYQFDYEYRKMMPRIKERIAEFTGEDFEPGEHPLHTLLEAQMNEYFDGNRKEFDLPLQLAGSSFQQKVWNNLLEIPYGETRSYKKQSQVFGDEKAIRAIATANGANTHAIIIPCHRVIGADGSLTGYAGGLHHKKWLLEHELSHSNVNRQSSLF